MGNRSKRRAAIVLWAVAALVLTSLAGVGAAAQVGHKSPAVTQATRIVYAQPVHPAGGLVPSSLRDPNGSHTDQWAWDGLALAHAESITEVRWRGAYDPARLGSGGAVAAFTVEIYASIAGDSQPDIVHPPLAQWEVAGNCGEMAAGMVGGLPTYDYRYALPTPFLAAAHTKYWLQIEAHQPGAPDWCLIKATGGDGSYFRRIAGEGANYQLVPGAFAFTLLGAGEGYTVWLPCVQRGS